MLKKSISPRATWAGRFISGFAVLFLTFDAVLKLFRFSAAMEGTVQLGYPPDLVLPIGLIEVACLIVYLVPRTSVFGAVLWTGYLGGAVATHFRIGNPLFTHMVFPIDVAAMLWGGLWLRDGRVRHLFSPRSQF